MNSPILVGIIIGVFFAGLGMGITVFQISNQTMQTTDAELEKYEIAEQIASEHLQTFDELDFDIFTNQKWERLHESHS